MYLNEKKTPNALHVTLVIMLAWQMATTTASAQPFELVTLSTMAQREADQFAAQSSRDRSIVQRQGSGHQLLSIHGVKPSLQATVLLDGEPVLLRHGISQRLPRSGKVVRLLAIRPPCVSLTSGGERHTLCLRGGL